MTTNANTLKQNVGCRLLACKAQVGSTAHRLSVVDGMFLFRLDARRNISHTSDERNDVLQVCTATMKKPLADVTGAFRGRAHLCTAGDLCTGKYKQIGATEVHVEQETVIW